MVRQTGRATREHEVYISPTYLTLFHCLDCSLHGCVRATWISLRNNGGRIAYERRRTVALLRRESRRYGEVDLWNGGQHLCMHRSRNLCTILLLLRADDRHRLHISEALHIGPGSLPVVAVSPRPRNGAKSSKSSKDKLRCSWCFDAPQKKKCLKDVQNS